MIKGVEAKRVIITLLAFFKLPINWVPMDVILRNRRWGSREKLVRP
jgi:hypothetical protein